MTDNRELAIAEVAEEIGWTTEQVSYCTYSVMCMAVNQCEQKLDLLDALKECMEVACAETCDHVTQRTPIHTPECINAIAAVAKAERKG